MSTLKTASLTALALTTAMGLSAAVHAENPFAQAELSSGYMQVAKADKEGKCGEAKCGADMTDNKSVEAKCGANTATDETKAMEGKCGEAKCGGAMTATDAEPVAKSDKEGKCGEGKCGGSK